MSGGRFLDDLVGPGDDRPARGRPRGEFLGDVGNPNPSADGIDPRAERLHERERRTFARGDLDEAQLPIVPYVPWDCPRCGAKHPKSYGQKGRLRYHRCRRCHTKYQSLEVNDVAITDDGRLAQRPSRTADGR